MSDKGKKHGFPSLLDASSVLSSLAAIVIGLIVGFFVLLFASPKDALPGFAALIGSGFGELKNMGNVLYFATPIIMTGVSVAFAGKTGLFNIGASGQFIVGGYCAILVGVRCTFLPGPLLCVAAILAAILAGAIWGALPGILKAWRNVNEVISCIMMNYIGMYLVNYLITLTVFDQRRNISLAPAANANMPKFGMDTFFNSGSVNSGIFLAVIAAVVIYIILEKTTLGYEIKACGYNKNAAEYAGINTNRGIVTAMVISGAMAGLGGALLYLSGAGKSIDVVDTLAAEGFNGIPVALLALNNPIGVIFSGLFVAYLTVGGNQLQLHNYAPQVVDIIISIIIYFSAAALLIKGFIQKLVRRGKDAPAKGGGGA